MGAGENGRRTYLQHPVRDGKLDQKSFSFLFRLFAPLPIFENCRDFVVVCSCRHIQIITDHGDTTYFPLPISFYCCLRSSTIFGRLLHLTLPHRNSP